MHGHIYVLLLTHPVFILFQHCFLIHLFSAIFDNLNHLYHTSQKKTHTIFLPGRVQGFIGTKKNPLQEEGGGLRTTPPYPKLGVVGGGEHLPSLAPKVCKYTFTPTGPFFLPAALRAAIFSFPLVPR